jgi:hypothetical protein
METRIKKIKLGDFYGAFPLQTGSARSIFARIDFGLNRSIKNTRQKHNN